MSTRTPWESWRVLTRNLSSPEVYVEAGFYALTAAALQRRVWQGSRLNEKPLFPNLFTLFSGDPGLGKGLVTDTILDILTQLEYIPLKPDGTVDEELRANLLAKKQKDGAPTLTIPIAPQNITFEKLTQNMARATRAFRVSPPVPAGVKNGVYMHASLTFVLDELESLMHKDADVTAKFFETVYNCKDYDRETKTQGEDRITSCCLNMIAGVQPVRLRKLVARGIMSGGLLGRCIVIHADEERQRMHKKPPYDAEQLAARQELIQYVKRLSEVFGMCVETPEADEWMKNWWASEKETRINRSPALKDYYARKNQHMCKMVMLIAFADERPMSPDGTYVLTIADYERARDVLARWERDMHRAFDDAGDNRIGNKAHLVDGLLKTHNRALTFDELFFYLMKDLRREELSELLADMVQLKRITQRTDKKNVVYERA
jgi:hypothetical protein